MTVRCVVDSNVLVSGLRSARGASHRLLRLIEQGVVRPVLSVPLVIEYEAVLKRDPVVVRLGPRALESLVDDLCHLGELQSIYFLWRPTLRDPGDEFLLELAVAAECPWIVTHNLRDFVGSRRYGVQAVTPREFLLAIGERP